MFAWIAGAPDRDAQLHTVSGLGPPPAQGSVTGRAPVSNGQSTVVVLEPRTPPREFPPFERDGFYDVGCDIHPGMAATIYSSTSPYVAVTDRGGQFQIHDVPPGPYTAVIYAGAEKIERPVDVVAGETELALVP